MLVLAETGQQLLMSKQNNSIKVYLNIVLTPSYVVSQLRDFEGGNIFLTEKLDFEKSSDSNLFLLKIKEILNIINIDLYDVVEPKLIFDNDYYTFVPSVLYLKGKEKTYLKFSTELNDYDFATSDFIEKLSIYNIYLPYVNINNYLIDKFQKLEFYHFNTVLLNSFLIRESEIISASVPGPDSCYCFIKQGYLKILILKNGEILFFNSYNYNSLDDILYYLILSLKDKNLEYINTPLRVYHDNENQEFEIRFKEFFGNVSFIKYFGVEQIL